MQKIFKFGGSSVGTPKMIKKVIEIVRAASKKKSHDSCSFCLSGCYR